MDPKNCCCFCFNARSGVMIIGGLLWMGLIATSIELSWLIYFSISENIAFYNWFWIPSLLVLLILGIMFCRVLSNENKDRDWETRKSFAKWYLVLACFVSPILSIATFIVGWIQFSNWCFLHGSEDNYNCNSLLLTYNFSFWNNMFWTVVIQAYFAHVCRLYANLADPLYRNQEN